MSEQDNPFIVRGRITDATRFVGRWKELSIIFDRLEQYRPVLLAGPPGVGKSSLLTHITQSAAENLERFDLAAFYADLAVLPNAEAAYALIVSALGGVGNQAASLEIALLEHEGAVLMCLDRAEAAIAAGWGELFLERLARMARSSRLGRGGAAALPETAGRDLLLVVAVGGSAPVLSEPFAVVTLGAFSPAEIRLLIDTYLDNTSVQFTPGNLRALNILSAGHPTYVQRAAYHLFIAKICPGYDWRAAYLEEAGERPVPGAPLPPSVFDGAYAPDMLDLVYDEVEGRPPELPDIELPQPGGLRGLVVILIPLAAVLFTLAAGGDWRWATLALVGGIALAAVVERVWGRKSGG